MKNVKLFEDFVNEGLSKSEINQIENYLDKYVDEDALFDMCNDFYTDDNEWHDVKNDLDKSDLISSKSEISNLPKKSRCNTFEPCFTVFIFSARRFLYLSNISSIIASNLHAITVYYFSLSNNLILSTFLLTCILGFKAKPSS